MVWKLCRSPGQRITLSGKMSRSLCIFLGLSEQRKPLQQSRPKSLPLERSPLAWSKRHTESSPKVEPCSCAPHEENDQYRVCPGMFYIMSLRWLLRKSLISKFQSLHSKPVEKKQTVPSFICCLLK